jgi:2-polyprenyl-6-methoxyphenol hydroxylase-like FAD-dependent oxidoreductase
MASEIIAGRAAVLGSGVAGLFAARVLADHFEEVVLVERDDVPDTPGPRGGVPQGNHFHALLPAGLAVADELFPGFTDDLAAAGAVPTVVGRDFVAYRPEGKSYALAVYQPAPRPLGTIYCLSRPLFEHCLRRRVDGLPNVRTRCRSFVRDALSEGGRVTGVVVEGGDPGDPGDRIAADLVVDAGGRNARTLAWLASLGYESPAESVVHCDFAYASALVRPADPDSFEGVGFFVLPGPDGEGQGRGAYVARVEGGNCIVGLGGRFGDYPPAQLDAWRDYGRTLAHPIWDEVVGEAELLTQPATFRFPRSVRRHFERLDTFPDGLVPLGDAICHFNPLYGQGMSAAAGQAMALAGVLRRRAGAGQDLSGLALELFPETFAVTRTPWALAAAADFMDARTKGDFPVDDMPSLMRFGALTALAASDPEAARLAGDITALVRPLSALDEPPWSERLAEPPG